MGPQKKSRGPEGVSLKGKDQNRPKQKQGIHHPVGISRLTPQAQDSWGETKQDAPGMTVCVSKGSMAPLTTR